MLFIFVLINLSIMNKTTYLTKQGDFCTCIISRDHTTYFRSPPPPPPPKKGNLKKNF